MVTEVEAVEAALFDLDGNGLPKPTADQAQAMRQMATMKHGRHPFGLPLHVDAAPADDRSAKGLRCRHCIHVKKNYRGYLKCAISTINHGPGTDLRLWWPACEKWEAAK